MINIDSHKIITSNKILQKHLFINSSHMLLIQDDKKVFILSQARDLYRLNIFSMIIKLFLVHVLTNITFLFI